MEGSLKEQFIEKLQERYGVWDTRTSRFGTTSFGVIAKDLTISASQFSKLIYGTATEGMYVRSIENINRLIQRDTIISERDEALAERQVLEGKLSQQLAKQTKNNRQRFLIFIASLALGACLMYFINKSVIADRSLTSVNSHPLSSYFDLDFSASFNSPYLDISEVQDFCPCSAYEGVWSLSEPYKLPLPGTRKSGVYYLGKTADVRMKCSRYDTLQMGKGRVLFGYEYLVNEIWVDTKTTPLSPKYFDKDSKTFTEAFENLSFKDNPQFKKVATIQSFFVDRFEIYNDSIVRKGEPCGRLATDIDEKLAEAYEIDIKFILNDVLGDLTTTNCAATTNPYCDPNDLQEGESVISFDCLYTIKTENLGFGGGYPYRKGYRLEKQIYSDNLTCYCED